MADHLVREGHVAVPGIPSLRPVHCAHRLTPANRWDSALGRALSGKLGGTRTHGVGPDRLATVLFTDIVGSTQRASELGDRDWRGLLEQHQALVRRELARWRGQEINTTGDGFLASFDGPARAIRCAHAVKDAVRTLGLQVRSGVHTGECERSGDDLSGIAVHIGARIAAEAEPGEVLVSGIIKDLVAGSGLRFDARGTRTLKGVPGEWPLYAAEV